METSEGNELIAKFMGYQILCKKYQTQRICSSNESTWVMDEDDIVCDANGNEVDDERQEPYFFLESLPFNYSWNWLMPVVDKLESTKNLEINGGIITDIEFCRRKGSLVVRVDLTIMIDGYSDGRSSEPIYQSKDGSDIDAWFKAVVFVIEWINNKKV